MAFDMSNGGVMTIGEGGGNRSLSLASMMAQMELAQQVAMAKGDPRDEKRCLLTLTENVQGSVAAAEECTYMLSRQSNNSDESNDIIGPTIRFAESVARSWKNCRYSAEVVEINDKFVVAEGRFFDLEAVTSVCRQVRRRITYRNGKTYSDDMIQVTSNACCSIALRDAILYGGVPSGFWRPVHEACMAMVRRETTGNLDSVVAKMLSAYSEIGVTEGTILNYLGRPNRGKMLVADVVRLRQLWQAIRSEEVNPKEEFGGFAMVAAQKTAAHQAAKGSQKSAQAQQQPAKAAESKETAETQEVAQQSAETTTATVAEKTAEPAVAAVVTETAVEQKAVQAEKPVSEPKKVGSVELVRGLLSGKVKDDAAKIKLQEIKDDPIAAWSHRVLCTEGIESLKIRGRELTDMIAAGTVSESDGKSVRQLVGRQMSMG